MFFSNPVLDMQITITLVVISAIIALIVFAFSKNLFKAVIIFSVLANLSFLINIESLMFLTYHIKFLKYFALFIWPIVNIFLIIKYFKNKK